jgi:hypothetical protein
MCTVRKITVDGHNDTCMIKAATTRVGLIYFVISFIVWITLAGLVYLLLQVVVFASFVFYRIFGPKFFLIFVILFSDFDGIFCIQLRGASFPSHFRQEISLKLIH